MSCEFQILVNMEKIVRKLYMNEELFEKVLLIRPLEKKLLSLILKHKFDQRNFRSCDFTVKNLNTIRQKKMRKKSEDGLKFIFKQFLHEIRTKFALERGLSSNAINTANFDYLFYGHHFGEISKKFQIPLERFFHFRNWRKRYSDLIPKSITKTYIKNLKLNLPFIKEVLKYLDEEYPKDFRLFNLKKIKRMLTKWEKYLKKMEKKKGF